MAGIAAQQGGTAEERPAADEGLAGLPQLSTYELLSTPMLALGAGLQMKRMSLDVAIECHKWRWL